MLILLANEAPYLIHLNAVAIKVAHLGIHQCCATLSDPNSETHNRIPMDAGLTLNGTNAGTFAQSRNNCDLLISAEYVRHILSVIQKMRRCQYLL